MFSLYFNWLTYIYIKIHIFNGVVGPYLTNYYSTKVGILPALYWKDWLKFCAGNCKCCLRTWSTMHKYSTSASRGSISNSKHDNSSNHADTTNRTNHAYVTNYVQNPTNYAQNPTNNNYGVKKRPAPYNPYHKSSYQSTNHPNQSKSSMTYDRERLYMNRKKDPSCGICSQARGNQYNHHHDSTQQHRVFARETSKDGMYFCVICKKKEFLKLPERRNILVSSSTLAGFWGDSSFSTEVHFDAEIIVGGTIRDGCRAWRRQYEHLPESADIIAVLGINNVGNGQSVDQIMAEFGEFKDSVAAHSDKFKYTIKNTFTVCTLIQPPKFMCFNEEAPYPHLKNGANKKQLIESVNVEIRKMNSEAGVWGPRLHVYGMHVVAKTGRHEHLDLKKDYKKDKSSWWKEPELHKRLHFTKSRRDAIAMKIAKHFQTNKLKINAVDSAIQDEVWEELALVEKNHNQITTKICTENLTVEKVVNDIDAFLVDPPFVSKRKDNRK